MNSSIISNQNKFWDILVEEKFGMERNFELVHHQQFCFDILSGEFDETQGESMKIKFLTFFKLKQTTEIKTKLYKVFIPNFIS